MMPGATFSPRLNLTFSLPSATTLVAKSCDIATVALGPGTATACGLVPRRRAAPPQGATFSAVGALAHVVRAPEGDRRQTLSPSLRDPQRDAVPRDDLAESLVAVDARDRRSL